MGRGRCLLGVGPKLRVGGRALGVLKGGSFVMIFGRDNDVGIRAGFQRLDLGVVG